MFVFALIVALFDRSAPHISGSRGSTSMSSSVMSGVAPDAFSAARQASIASSGGSSTPQCACSPMPSTRRPFAFSPCTRRTAASRLAGFQRL